jgi:hypothetical protein
VQKTKADRLVDQPRRGHDKERGPPRQGGGGNDGKGSEWRIALQRKFFDPQTMAPYLKLYLLRP